MTPPKELREAPAGRGDFPCHELAEWAANLGIVAGITDRGADFGLTSAEPTGVVLGRWRRLRRAMSPGFTTVTVAHQCHGSTVTAHEAPGPGWRVRDDVDGHLTGQPGILLGVTVADCVPVYLAQEAGSWLGLLHAGWRGIAAGIVERGISRLCELGECTPADIVIHCGVSVCGMCYEVGPEVHQGVAGEATSDKRPIDLRAWIAKRAERAGVLRVTVSPWCTAHDDGAFYSHRRSGGTDGRMVAYAGRPSP